MSFPLDVAAGAPDVAHLRVPRRSITAVNSYPVNGNRTLLTARILSALAQHARLSFAQYSNEERQRIRESRGTPLFKIRVGELRDLIDEAGKDTQRIYDAIDAIHKWDIRWDLVQGEGEEAVIVDHFTSHVISSFGVSAQKTTGNRSAATTISFEFPFDVLMLMLEQRPQTQIELRVMNEIGSSHAAALYDQCVPYFGSAKKATPMRPVTDWITILVGAGKYNDKYKDFKRYVLKPAIAWLETVRNVPFTVEIVEKSVAKGRVTHLQFQLVPKIQTNMDFGSAPLTWSPELIDVLTKVYGVTAQQMADMAVTHTEAEVAEAIDRDHSLHQRGSGSDRSSVPRQHYLLGLIKNVQLGLPPSEEPDLSDIAPATPEVTDARARVQQMRIRFEAERDEQLVERLDRLGSRIDALRAVFLERVADGAITDAPSATVLAKGWRKTNRPLLMAFAHWLAEREPGLTRELMPRPEEHDFAVWLLLEQQRDIGTNSNEGAAG